MHLRLWGYVRVIWVILGEWKAKWKLLLLHHAHYLASNITNLICGIAGIDGKHYKEYSIMWYDIA